MKRAQYSMFVVTFILLLVLGCTTFEPERPAVDPNGEEFTVTFTARYEASEEEQSAIETRATYTHGTPSGSYRWTGSEELSVFIVNPSGTVTHSNVKFTAVAGSLASDGSSVDFSGNVGTQPVAGSTYYLVYPYSSTRLFRIVGEEHLIDVDIPVEQEYSETGTVNVPMLARVTGGNTPSEAIFTSMCAKIVIPLKITSSNSSWSSPLRSVRIRCNTVDTSNDNSIFYTHIAGRGRFNVKNYTPSKTIVPDNNGSRTASVVFPDSGLRIRNGTTLTVVIMTKELFSQSATGITIDLITADGWIASKTFKPQSVVGRFQHNRATILPELTVDLDDFNYFRINNNTTPKAPTQGSGTEADPWLITTPNEFVGIESFLTGDIYNIKRNNHVRLETDIEITSDSWTPILADMFAIGTVFDGNGHIISGQMVNKTNTEGFGLWNSVAGLGTVKNLHISADITDQKGVKAIGPFFGYMNLGSNQSFLIENCTYSGTITNASSVPDDHGVIIGGIFGWIEDEDVIEAINQSVTISKCAMTGSVKIAYGDQLFSSGILGQTECGGTNTNIIIDKCIVAGTFDCAVTGMNSFTGVAFVIEFDGVGGGITISNNTISPNVFIPKNNLSSPLGLSFEPGKVFLDIDQQELDPENNSNKTAGLTIVYR